jgi:hypothetical protein
MQVFEFVARRFMVSGYRSSHWYRAELCLGSPGGLAQDQDSTIIRWLFGVNAEVPATCLHQATSIADIFKHASTVQENGSVAPPTYKWYTFGLDAARDTFVSVVQC